MIATSELVGGTVESHRIPITEAKTITEKGVCGKSKNSVTAMDRPIYI